MAIEWLPVDELEALPLELVEAINEGTEEVTE